MKILITGGAGFLGLHLAEYLEKKGHTLTLADIADFDRKEYPGSYRLVPADIRDRAAITKLIKGQDMVIHAAAALPLSSRYTIFTTNVDGTQNVLDAAIQHKVQRLVYISSTAVYGVPKKHPIEETDPMVGVGPYGISKIEAEHRCLAALAAGHPITILRPKTFLGGGRLGVFEILFDWIHDGKRIPVIGSGNNHYQLLDVDDLVEAVSRFLQKNHPSYNDVFNIGAASYGTVKEDLQRLFDVAHSGSRIFPTPAWPVKKTLWIFEKLNLSPLYQWVYDTADKDSFVSIEKLKKTLRWTPRYSNSDALIKAFRWYQKHYDEIKARSPGTTHTVGWDQGILRVFKRFL